MKIVFQTGIDEKKVLTVVVSVRVCVAGKFRIVRTAVVQDRNYWHNIFVVLGFLIRWTVNRGTA